MRAARWTTPSLRLRSILTGTSQLPAPFESNPTLLRPPLLSQRPTECMEGILSHPVFTAVHFLATRYAVKILLFL